MWGQDDPKGFPREFVQTFLRFSAVTGKLGKRGGIERVMMCAYIFTVCCVYMVLYVLFFVCSVCCLFYVCCLYYLLLILLFVVCAVCYVYCV